MSKFFCDTNCEINYLTAEELQINVIKMPYTMNGVESYYDLGKETRSDEFFDKMRNGAVVRTSALNEFDYEQYFEPVLQSGEDIVYATFSHAMSATFNSMYSAIEKLLKKYPQRKVHVINTRNISMGAGIIVEILARYHATAANDEAVIAYANTVIDRSRCYFTVDDLSYLKRGGRISAVKAFLGSILNMKPIISANSEGMLENIATVKGRKKALATIVSFLTQERYDDKYNIYVVDADNDKDAEYMVSLVKEVLPNAQVCRQDIGPVVGCHCGPDTIGLVYIAK